jgi:hypothetical protein
MVGEFSAAGSRLSILLPRVFKAYRKAAAETTPLLEAMREAAARLEAEEPAAAAAALAGARLRIGVFLGAVDATRRRALEALAEAESGSSRLGERLSMERALESIREASRLLSAGKVGAALAMQRATARGLAAASGALSQRIERLSAPAGEEGPLTSQLLEEEARRHGLVWQVETRASELPAITAGEEETTGWLEMPYPRGYRELIRIYRRAIESGD